MHAMPARAWLVVGGLAVMSVSAPLAQEPAGQAADAQALIDRIRQIQDEVAPGAQEAQEPGPQELATQGSARPETTPETAPQMTEQQVRTLLRDSLGVEVLRVEVVEQATGPAYAVTVMMPPGNRNNALMGATLLVDGATGALLGERSAVPRTAAPDLPTATGGQVPESGGRDIRRRTLR